MNRLPTLIILFVLHNCISFPCCAQTQDSTINNLLLPEDYVTQQLGNLGNVVIHGKGKRNLILIAGWGFGSHIFKKFMERNSEEYTMYAVTLPGFGNTPAPPIPNVSYGEQIWTQGAAKGIMDLIHRKEIKNPILIGHFLTGTQVALRLALDHPETIKKVIVVGGAPKLMVPNNLKRKPTLQERIDISDNYYAPKWFKHVTEIAWDEGNYPPEVYSQDAIIGRALWKESAGVPVPVMIQYLSEFNASDLTLELNRLKVPTLVMVPDFKNETLSKLNYIGPTFQEAWEEVSQYPYINIVKVANSATFVMLDQPHYFAEMVWSFVNK